jgi:hypothetical protein
MRKKKLTIEFCDYKKSKPTKNKSWYLCIFVPNGPIGKQAAYPTIRSAFWEDGTFWDSSASDAEGYGRILYWAPIDEIDVFDEDEKAKWLLSVPFIGHDGKLIFK